MGISVSAGVSVSQVILLAGAKNLYPLISLFAVALLSREEAKQRAES